MAETDLCGPDVTPLSQNLAVLESLRRLLDRSNSRQRYVKQVKRTATGAGTNAVIDLTSEWGLTFALLDDTRAWRERSVHEFVLRDSDHVESTLTYQIRIPLELLRRYAPQVESGDRVRLLLPYTVRPKQLLLNVEFFADQGPAVSLLLRQEAAELQAQYIAHVDGRSLGDQVLGGSLWLAISAYTTASWLEHLAHAKSRRFPRIARSSGARCRADALVGYLNADLDLGIQRRHVVGWLQQLEPVRTLLVESLGEEPDPVSASECILLAIPFMPYKPDRIAEVDLLVVEYCCAIETMSHRTRQVVAEYGRRWEAIVEMTVVADAINFIGLSEQRPWLDSPSSTMKQEIAFGDSTTTHVEIRAADHGVVITKPTISDLTGQRLGFAVGDAMRETADAVAIYASDSKRPYFAAISVRVRVRRSQRLLIWWLLVLIIAGAVVALALPEDAHLVDSLALLIFPITLAGAIVLARDSTSLAERLLRGRRALLAVAIGILWAITLARVLLSADVGWAEAAWSDVVAMFEWAKSQLR